MTQDAAYSAPFSDPSALMFSACTAVTREISSRSASAACSCASWLWRCETCLAFALLGAREGRTAVRVGCGSGRGGMVFCLFVEC